MKESLPAALNKQAGDVLTVGLCDRELAQLSARLKETSKDADRKALQTKIDMWLDQRLAFTRQKRRRKPRAAKP